MTAKFKHILKYLVRSIALAAQFMTAPQHAH